MANASEWDQNYQGDAARELRLSKSSHLIRRRLELYRELFPQAPGKTLLEVGCAPGDWLVMFAREFGLQVTGLDFAPLGCERAREKLSYFGVDGRVIEADFLQWEPAGELFDMIFFQGSLEHFPDCQAGLERAKRALRPNGLILAQIPCFAPCHINTLLNRTLAPADLADHYTRDLAQMESAFRAAGLREVRSRRFGTFQLILNEQANPTPWFKVIRHGVALADRVGTTLLDRTDLRCDLSGISPHVLTWGRL
jgi:ubiquinone/menaquinone biosynthesis C-methylase UbiE